MDRNLFLYWNGNEYKLILSHDVDRPFFYHSLSIPRLSRILLGDILKRRNIPTAINRLRLWININYFKIN